MRRPIFVVRSHPKGSADLLPPHFVWPQRYSGLRTLHPLLKPNGGRRLLFKSHFFFRISLCFLISHVKLSNLPFFLLILIKACGIFTDFACTLLLLFLFFFPLLLYALFVCLHFVVLTALRNKAAVWLVYQQALCLMCSPTGEACPPINIYILNWPA